MRYTYHGTSRSAKCIQSTSARGRNERESQIFLTVVVKIMNFRIRSGVKSRPFHSTPLSFLVYETSIVGERGIYDLELINTQVVFLVG